MTDIEWEGQRLKISFEDFIDEFLETIEIIRNDIDELRAAITELKEEVEELRDEIDECWGGGAESNE